MLALAHKIREAIARGQVRDQADVARRLGFTRARVTQLMDLTLLAPDLQERVLGLEAVDGVEPISERVLRTVVHAGSWADQTRVLGHRCR
jgi:ParB-like chromosome segregation protein Spo0J